jgi:hypothetical protein
LFNNSIEPIDTKRSIDDIPLRNARVAEEEGAAPDIRRPAKQADPLVDVVADKHNLYTTDKKFPTTARVYYSDYQQKQEVMRAKPNEITTKLDDRQTIGAMLDLAQARGWQSVKLRGTDEFEREAWVQAQARGMKTEGYTPTNTDKQEVERRWATALQREERAAAAPERNTVLQATKAVAAERLAAAKARPPDTVKAASGDEDAWRKEQDKAGAAPTAAQQEKAVWAAKEAQGKAAREQDQPVQKPTEKAGERPTMAA